MTVPRVLLLTGTAPGYPGVGGIFLHDLCLLYPRDSICCFAVIPPHGASTSPDLDWLSMTYNKIPRQRGYHRLGRHLADLSGLPVRQYARLIRTPLLASRSIQLGRRHDVEMVWVVLNDPILVYMARRVASALGVPFVGTIWDPPERLAMNLGFDGLSRRIYLHEFENVLRASLRCGVASKNMKEEYERRYQTESIVLIHGIHPKLRRLPAKKPTKENEFIVGFAGSLYAQREWQALLSALSNHDWQIAGREVTIRLMGSDVYLRAQGAMRIEYLGWRSVEETVALMSEVDVLYLPYWFDEDYRLAVRLCFPNKLTIYLATGRPVFYHGPKDSSPAQFFRRYPVGLCCHSLDETEIIGSLSRIATDEKLYARATQAGQIALDQELDLRVLRRRFAQLIGVQESDLLPI